MLQLAEKFWDQGAELDKAKKQCNKVLKDADELAKKSKEDGKELKTKKATIELLRSYEQTWMKWKNKYDQNEHLIHKGERFDALEEAANSRMKEEIRQLNIGNRKLKAKSEVIKVEDLEKTIKELRIENAELHVALKQETTPAQSKASTEAKKFQISSDSFDLEATRLLLRQKREWQDLREKVEGIKGRTVDGWGTYYSMETHVATKAKENVATIDKVLEMNKGGKLAVEREDWYPKVWK